MIIQKPLIHIHITTIFKPFIIFFSNIQNKSHWEFYFYWRWPMKFITLITQLSRRLSKTVIIVYTHTYVSTPHSRSIFYFPYRKTYILQRAYLIISLFVVNMKFSLQSFKDTLIDRLNQYLLKDKRFIFIYL